MIPTKLSRLIVRNRKIILLIMALLTLLAAAQIGRVNINYDFTVYLNKRTITRQSLELMQHEFGSNEQLRMMFADQTDEQMLHHVETISGLDGVLLAAYDPAKDQKNVDEISYHLVSITLGDTDATQMVHTLRATFANEDCVVAGAAADMLDVQCYIGTEIPFALIISVLIVAVVLFLTSRSWLEVPIVLTVLASAILINMGTNWVFPSMSFVTFAVCAILQLALSMDYGIMLVHAFHDLREQAESNEYAMEQALSQCFMPVLSSGFTTIAGLLSLLVMSFTIGFDIGLALSKGIVISMISVFVLMPALILLLAKPLNSTKHKTLPLGGKKLASFCYKTQKVLPLALIIIIAAACIIQTGNTYLFTDRSNNTPKNPVVRIFGESNPVVALVPTALTDEDFEKQKTLAQALLALEIEDAPLVTSLQSMVTTGEAALKTYTAKDVADMVDMPAFAVQLFWLQASFPKEGVRGDMLIEKAVALLPDNQLVKELYDTLQLAKQSFQGKEYDCMLLTLAPLQGTESNSRAIEAILNAMHAVYGQDIGLTGTAVSTYDISNAFASDMRRVSIITLVAIWLVVALSFRSARMPWLLLLVIQGAIWVTMSVSRLLGQPIFFISYLICMAIQMGATIDYAILLASHYRTLRKTLDKKAALSAALHAALPTILTSGSILVSAGFVVGKFCSIYYISSIGLLLSRGAAISVLLVLTLLPALLVIFDQWIIKAPRASDPSIS